MKNDKIKIFDMRTAIIVTIIVLMVGVVSAALVLSYSTTVGTVKVNPVLIVEPSTYILTVGNDTHGNNRTEVPVVVTNYASMNISAYLDTTITFPDGSLINGTGGLGKNGVRIKIFYEYPNHGVLTQPTNFTSGDTNISLVIHVLEQKLDPGDYVITIKANPVP